MLTTEVIASARAVTVRIMLRTEERHIVRERERQREGEKKERKTKGKIEN
jgi:hypothetical protein